MGYACSPVGQLYSELHQENHDQQAKGGDSAPLLCSRETPPGALHPVLGPPTQEGHRAVGECLEEGHEDDQKGGAPPLLGQPGRDGAFQLREEKATGGPYSSLQVCEGAPIGKLGRDFL